MGITKFKSIHYILIWLIFLGTLTGIYFTVFYKKPLQIFPENDNYTFIQYDDQSEGGNSQIVSTEIKDSTLSSTFILREGFISPYIGIRIHPIDWEEDISAYNTLEVVVSSNSLKHMNLFLITGDENVKDQKHRLADRHSVYGLTVSPEKKKTTIDLNEFKTPDWWYTSIDQLPGDFGKPELQQFKGFALSTGVNPALNKRHTIQISNYTLKKDNTASFLILSFIQFFFTLALVLIYKQRNYNKKRVDIQPITIEYKAIPLPESKEDDENFMEYIHENYSDPELSLGKISKETGVQQRQITETIAENFACNFKTYINTIRIKEAQRLLKESDLNISEIAYKTGFNSPSSFNRVFKNIVGKSPTEYKVDS